MAQVLLTTMSIAFHSTRFYSLLLSAIWNHLIDLMSREKMPVIEGKMEKKLYYLYNIVMMIEHNDKLIKTLPYHLTRSSSQLPHGERGMNMERNMEMNEKRVKMEIDSKNESDNKNDKGDDWSASWFLSDEIKRMPTRFTELLTSIIVYIVQHITDQVDEGAIQDILRYCSASLVNLHLIISSLNTQCLRLLSFKSSGNEEEEDYEFERKILKGMCTLVTRLPDRELEREWNWIESACLTAMSGEVGE